MFRSTLLVALTALAARVSAQNYSTMGNLSVDTSQISSSLKADWCRAQLISCPEICGGIASANTCDQNTLAYTCSCQDGSHPNISDYQSTVPFFVCQQWITNCVKSHPDDRDGQQGCRSVTCGQKNASEAEGGSATESSSASASSGMATATSSGSGSSASESAQSSQSASSTASSAAMATAFNLAQNYGTGIVGAGLLAAFGLAL